MAGGWRCGGGSLLTYPRDSDRPSGGRSGTALYPGGSGGDQLSHRRRPALQQPAGRTGNRLLSRRHLAEARGDVCPQLEQGAPRGRGRPPAEPLLPGAGRYDPLVTEVVADNVRFLDWPKDDRPDAGAAADPFDGFEEDEVPF